MSSNIHKSSVPRNSEAESLSNTGWSITVQNDVGRWDLKHKWSVPTKKVYKTIEEYVLSLLESQKPSIEGRGSQLPVLSEWLLQKKDVADVHVHLWNRSQRSQLLTSGCHGLRTGNNMNNIKRR